jgi:hypothetical protein
MSGDLRGIDRVVGTNHTGSDFVRGKQSWQKAIEEVGGPCKETCARFAASGHYIYRDVGEAHDR